MWTIRENISPIIYSVLLFPCKIFIRTLSKTSSLWVTSESCQVKVCLWQEPRRICFFSLSSLFLLWTLLKCCTDVMSSNNITNHELFGLRNVMRKSYIYEIHRQFRLRGKMPWVHTIKWHTQPQILIVYQERQKCLGERSLLALTSGRCKQCKTFIKCKVSSRCSQISPIKERRAIAESPVGKELISSP